MGKSVLGVDIGSASLKLALCSGGKVLALAEEVMPEKLAWDGRIVSAEAMAEFLKASLKKNRIRANRCSLVLPSSQVFVRRITLPAMTEEHLRLNLPYEFRDFITEEKDKYFYDYAVLSTETDEAGKPVQLNLTAAAVPKALIQEYRDMCRWAGLKLTCVIPMELAYVNLMRDFPQPKTGDEEVEQCFIDLGHTGTRVYFFKGEGFEALRTADRGGAILDETLAEQLSVDAHIARTRKEANVGGELENPAVTALFTDIATDVMRSLNFYSYNNQSNTLRHGWLCGGGARIAPLLEVLRETLGIELHPFSEMAGPGFPVELTDVCFAAIGAAQQ